MPSVDSAALYHSAQKGVNADWGYIARGFSMPALSSATPRR
jgi:hypothetical protein